jgi:3-oxoadipate enol-lactonase
MPLLSEAVLTDTRSVVHYYRRGYGESPSLPKGFGIADQAADLRVLMRELGLTRAHVLGHSIGASIAMQAALDDPDLVCSLVLVEPTWVSRPEVLSAFSEQMAPVFTAYAAGDSNGAARLMLQLIDGDSYASILGPALGPAWFDAAVDALDVYMQSELPAAVAWTLDAEQASRLPSSVLVLTGARSLELFKELAEDTIVKFPSARRVVIADATHNVIATRPTAAATTMQEFLVECERPA